MTGGVVWWEVDTHGPEREANYLGSTLTAPLALLTAQMWEVDTHGLGRTNYLGLNRCDLS